MRRALLASSVVCLLLISLPAQATDCPWPEAYDGTVDTLESLLPDRPLKGNERVHISIDCATTVAPAHCAELNRQVNAYIQCRIAEARRQATTPSTRPTPRRELPSTGANEILLLLVVGLALAGRDSPAWSAAALKVEWPEMYSANGGLGKVVGW